MSHDESLAALFVRADLLNNQSIDKVVAQVSLWLVEYQGCTSMCQQKRQHGSYARPTEA